MRTGLVGQVFCAHVVGAIKAAAAAADAASAVRRFVLKDKFMRVFLQANRPPRRE
jgi:hypothetical protein